MCDAKSDNRIAVLRRLANSFRTKSLAGCPYVSLEDVLKIVQIEGNHSQRVSVTEGAHRFGGQTVLGHAPVVEAGKGIDKRQPLELFRARMKGSHFRQLLGKLPTQLFHHYLLIDGLAIEEQDQSNQTAHGSRQTRLKKRVITFIKSGKLMEKTANVNMGMTMTAMLQSHQSRRSNFRSWSSISIIFLSPEGFSGDTDGN
jgi:hypothetical protein